tara:strand:- start:60 stop:176 length:117 start_codon:yes stop_codon:yes gene_type:complete
MPKLGLTLGGSEDTEIVERAGDWGNGDFILVIAELLDV